MTNRACNERDAEFILLKDTESPTILQAHKHRLPWVIIYCFLKQLSGFRSIIYKVTSIIRDYWKLSMRMFRVLLEPYLMKLGKWTSCCICAGRPSTKRNWYLDPKNWNLKPSPSLRNQFNSNFLGAYLGKFAFWLISWSIRLLPSTWTVIHLHRWAAHPIDWTATVS